MKDNVVVDSDQQQDTNGSLDNTARLGGAGHDELVPSRYALRVGEIDVLVVSDGVLPIPASTIAHNVGPGRPNCLAERHVPIAGHARLATECGRCA